MGTNRFTDHVTDWYMNGMGETSQFVDKYVMKGSTANLGQVAGEYDSGCASGLDVAWAGAQFGGNLALNVIPGGGEARGAEVAAHAAEEGIYDVVTQTGERYVGQSGDITRRLAEHVADEKITKEAADNAIRIGVDGGKDAREIAEQLRIDSYGGKRFLANKVNPIGRRRIGLLGPGYLRP